MPIGAEDRVVFSVLYNESAEFLAAFIDNFLAHTGPESLLVLNLPPGRALPPVPPAGQGRVFPINGRVVREKLGHTLLAGHLEAFDFAARQLGRFGHFCALASNSLLVRRFDRAATLRQLAAHRHLPQLDLADPPDDWWWNIIRRNPRVIRSLAEDWDITQSLGGQIEGLFAAREDWALVHARFDAVLRLGALMEPGQLFPLEEVLPVAVFLNQGSGRYLNLCQVHWTRSDGGRVTADDLLGAEAELPPHICAMKWFDRSADAPPTAAVTEGWSRALLAAWTAGDANQRLGQRLLLEQLTRAMRAREVFLPFARNWWGEAGAGPRGFAFHPPVLEARGGQVPVPTGHAAADAARAAFLFLAATGHRLQLHIEATEGAATRLRITCRAAEPVDQPGLEGHLYLSALQPAGHWTCRLRLSLADGAAQAMAPGHLVLARAGRFAAVAPQHVTEAEGFREYHFRWGDAGTDGPVWLGLPFQTDSYFEVLLDRSA